MKYLPTKRETSEYTIFGAILRYTNTNDITKYAMVQGKYTGKWSFPKGHSKDAETPLECTIRELKEETSVDIQSLPEPSMTLNLQFGKYFIFDLNQEIRLIPGDTTEIANTRWITLEEMKHLRLNADANEFLRNYTLSNLDDYCIV